VETKLSDVKVGDVVVTLDHKRQKRLSTVQQLPHSKSTGDFIEITLSGADSPAVEEAPAPAHMAPAAAASLLQATEHHTFPTCGRAKPANLRSASHLAQVPMVEAKDIKAGSCVLTLEGERLVASVKRRLASAKDVTYTVQLDGGSDLLVVGGVVSHAKPSHAAFHDLSTKEKVEAATQKLEFGSLKAKRFIHSIEKH
jgi:hypothetical protein